MDMVLDKEPGVEKDMLKEGLDLYIDGNFIKAKGTTLGADNGVGVAFMMIAMKLSDKQKNGEREVTVV